MEADKGEKIKRHQKSERGPRRALIDDRYIDVDESQKSLCGVVRGPKEVSFTVYGDPVPKARPRVVNGHAYTPRKTKAYEETVAFVYKSRYHGIVFEKNVPLRVIMDFFFAIPSSETKKRREEMLAGKIRPTKRKADIDNLQKCVADALNGVAYYDDAQIVEMVGRKHYAIQSKTEIYIAGVGAPNDE